jgi:hypothetical protein
LSIKELLGIKEVSDIVLGGSGLASPFWLQLLDLAAAQVTILGGGIIVLVRLFFMYREWKRRK